MKTLFVLVGIQGSGKSTALEFLKNKGFKILKPTTTRTQRSATDDEYFRVFECPVSLGQKETRLYFDPSILDYPLWQAEPELL